MDGKSHFHSRLDALGVKVLNMALLAETAVRNAFRSLSANNAALASQVIEKDREIDLLECAIDEECLKLLALEQPVALDLRRVVGAMRITIDLERIGDEAANIAERALLLGSLSPAPLDPLLADLANQAFAMFAKAAAAYRDGDSALAREVRLMDERTNELHETIIKQRMRSIRGVAPGLGAAERAAHEILVARSLERVGDQTTNIAEAVIFIVEGVSLKHLGRPSREETAPAGPQEAPAAAP